MEREAAEACFVATVVAWPAVSSEVVYCSGNAGRYRPESCVEVGAAVEVGARPGGHWGYSLSRI
jgi:hypothetical protein